MSTRGAYFFKDEHDHHMVYVHSDNYPTGAAQALVAGRKLAWAGARFEPDEAAAAFVAAKKMETVASRATYATSSNRPADNGGNVRLMHKSKDDANIFAACVQCCDIDFAYVVESKKNDWHVTAYQTSFWEEQTAAKAKKIWAGPLSKMESWAAKYEA